MFHQIPVLTFCSILCIYCIWTKAAVLPGAEYSTPLCPVQEIYVNSFGSVVRTVKCRDPGFGKATHSLSGTPHWCLQDYLEVSPGNSNTVFFPSGCSLWVKNVEDTPMEEIDVFHKTGLKKLGRVRTRHQHVLWGILGTRECFPMVEGLNSGSDNLRATDYWCRQQTISLPFTGDVPSGCNCYVR